MAKLTKCELDNMIYEMEREIEIRERTNRIERIRVIISVVVLILSFVTVLFCIMD